MSKGISGGSHVDTEDGEGTAVVGYKERAGGDGFDRFLDPFFDKVGGPLDARALVGLVVEPIDEAFAVVEGELDERRDLFSARRRGWVGSDDHG